MEVGIGHASVFRYYFQKDVSGHDVLLHPPPSLAEESTSSFCFQGLRN